MSMPNSPRTSPRKGKYLECKVHMLDDSWQQFWIHPKSLGQVLYDEVIKHLQLLESDYFDLEYKNPEGFCSWLDHEKPVLKQLSPPHVYLKFLVKFYTPDPGLLEEEYTRYLFALQVKRDLETGAMPCQEHTAVLLASYVVQAELGDFLEDEYLDHTYLSQLKLLPQQNDNLLIKIMDHHREHIGQTPEQADFNLLDTARKVELYGIRMHPAKDHEGVALQLAVAHMGVLVFQNYTKINTFSWAKIRKLSFKRKKFLIKLHPEGYGYYKDTVEFYFDSRNECKNFWKKCIEHHAFFRCHVVKKVPRNKTRVVSRGSSFRYSGRTQKQLVEFVRENYVKRPPFERVNSLRSTGSRTGRRKDVNSQPTNSQSYHSLSKHSPRTTSLRTVSSTRSAVATPKTGTLNSRDIHFGRDANQNPSTSSGSHTIDMSRSNENMMDSTQAEVHDESFNSMGRRPRSSPRRDRSYDRSLNRSLDRAHERAQNHYQVSPPMPPPRDDYQRQMESEKVPSYNEAVHAPVAPAYDELSPRLKRLDPAQFMLTQQDRKFSAPQFPISEQEVMDERHLARSPELENIPDRIQDIQPGEYDRMPSSLHRSQSATSPDSLPRHMDSAPGQPDSVPRHATQPTHFPYPGSQMEESLPPPPPPIYEEEMAKSPREGRQKAWVTQKHDDTYVSRSTTSAASVTLTSSMSVPSSRGTEDSEEDAKRKRSPADKAYYIAKELLMTERTYKKDLELITVWFRQAVSQEDVMPEHLMELLFLSVDPLYEYHVSFLKEVEQRLAMWEGKSNAHLNGEYRRIGDVILNNLRVLQLYCEYMKKQDDILTELELAIRQNKPFEQVYREFESQKVCYLPLNTFLLKPAQRLLHYQLILERLLHHYTPDHPDYEDCSVCLEKINQVTSSLQDKLRYLENKQKLIELQRDLVGVDNLVLPNRQFIREGCLQKLSRKGYQQRMFFLFSDMLLYTSRTATPSLQFKIHGQLPLRGMIVEETDPKMAVANSFTIYGGNRCLLVAASSPEERDKWLEDLQLAISNAKEHEDDPKILYPSLKSNSSSEALEDSHEEHCPPSPDRQIQHRANTTMHVCWHRNTSVSMRDHNIAVENQLSGYLLRKFKNSNGWQKLWVVFTNFCLFFYKTYQDDFPLASLPLLGYSVTTPTEADGIHKDYVFKLQFKNHVYFFRAESEYTFGRWIEVIQSATDSARIARLFSRVDSQVPANAS